MKWKEEYYGSISEVIVYLNQKLADISSNSLSLEKQTIKLPAGEVVKCGVKYAEEYGEYQLTLKLKWGTTDESVTEEEEVEEEVEVEVEEKEEEEEEEEKEEEGEEE